ncbi:hypothetical protein NBT05_17270 [Aquimarina sp. ERC-38]|uniref:hypothetical protein n=1 Tax=Aquimarina sp. ERC-38 TaxID=2949996 RepID=UPI00224653D7|nr:hypothetical protein [Aquimarina sp. ERC-38]UZO80679.1 hypothetical protein NBT05_17270 [Aquimarina sp. ERC-38]
MITQNKIILFTTFYFSLFFVSAQNLLNQTPWEVGTIDPPGYNKRGLESENARELGLAPDGTEQVLWVTKPDADRGPDGGFNSSNILVDQTKTYQFSVWIKKTNSLDGINYFIIQARTPTNGNSGTLKLDNTPVSKGFTWISDFAYDFEELDKWYLLVGYIHPLGYTGTTHQGGIYDPETGNKLAELRDHKFSEEAHFLRIAAYSLFSQNINDRTYYYQPTLEIVNGFESNIDDLLKGNTNSVWLQKGDEIFYTEGGVRIGTEKSDPDYSFTVAGKIHVQEVKVDLLGAIEPPDYVFYEDYNLKTLGQVQNYIVQNGHLPNIPSANEMKEEGINLKEFNLKLLEKIEELTLYTIAQEKELKKQKTVNSQLEERLQKIEQHLSK